ncbi:GNAT family acetyltransferase [Pontibacillus halophilus JSM 076056 = DSM 19796]|uniref:GNAT family acetyltransferase n=1 Tax=Pontibacillus halophilus JSM 076056 = DSM 19796 TaxID=1385510 RepID=A0A0A5GGN7_9BACI|nr:GNAT family N-acetyltransferase [Pontibacillus halophilus]KGX92406.1 GNAT family acetyltransferase [Pontibacillus halophilus JSM 076056 = DSM 19796]
MSETKWEIREATMEDASSLTTCMVMAYSTYNERLDGAFLPPMHVDYKEEIASFPVFVIEDKEEIIGASIVMYEDDYLQIANIAVRPDYQGEGLGRVLMEFAESIARDKGYSEMRLATHALLTENRSYYLHLGWEESGRDETRIYMKKAITEK